MEFKNVTQEEQEIEEVTEATTDLLDEAAAGLVVTTGICVGKRILD